jgi:hypothetical protein
MRKNILFILFPLFFTFSFAPTNTLLPKNTDYNKQKFLSPELLKTAALVFGAALAYGNIQDQITARVSLEYFSKGFHDENLEIMRPRLNAFLKKHNSPTLYAITWGTIATSFLGALLGGVTAFACRAGPLPKLDAKDLIKPVIAVMGVMGLATLIGGIKGYYKAKNDPYPFQYENYRLKEPFPKDKELRYRAIASAHRASYSSAFYSSLLLLGWIVAKRFMLKKKKSA